MGDYKIVSFNIIHIRALISTHFSSSTRMKAAPGAARHVIGPFLKTSHCNIARTARMGELSKSSV
jgi:hypothetical protein